MKQNKIKSAVLGMFFAFFAPFLITNSVFAEGNVFKLVAAEISDQSSTTEASILNADDSKITNSIVFHGLGEYVSYNLSFKNTDSEPRRIISVAASDENNLLEYEYESSIDATIDPGNTFEFALKAIYANEITDPSNISQIFNTTITITLEKTNEEGEEEESIEDVVVPNTGAKTAPGDTAYGSIAIAVIVGIAIASLFYARRHKKAALPIVAIAVAATTFGISYIVSATATVDEDFYMENDVTFYYRECTGVCYYGNGDDGIGTMADEEAYAGEEIILSASNFSRSGYGFAGWNTKADGTGTNYGPNQFIEMPDDELRLYANWVESAGSMTGFACERLSIGEITALTDERDNQTYAVSRLADGNCWTIENMRYATENSFNENTENRDDRPSSDGAIYSYGNYYNAQDNLSGDICPAGWGIPLGEYDVVNEYQRLETKLGGETALEKIKNWANYPNNFIFAGVYYSGMSEYYGTDYVYRGMTGYYHGNGWHSDGSAYWDIAAALLALPGVVDENEAFMVAGEVTNVNLTQGLSARCRVYPTRDITLSYDANGGEGPIPESQTIATSGLWAEGFVVGEEEPTREHYVFVGWIGEEFKDVNPNDTDEGGYPYSDYTVHAGDILDLNEDTTAYALWEENCTTIHYLSNGGDDSAPAMEDQVVCPPDNEIVDLIAPNYSREGYSYVGWNTKADGSGAMYGPNQNIEVPDVDDVYLYAQWARAEQNITMQTFDGTAEPYASAGANTVIALRDERDNQTYAVAKLVDGNWWMIENLRLDLNDANTSITAANTDNPTQDFLDEYNTNFHGNAASTMADCADSSYACEDQISFGVNNINREYDADPNTDSQEVSWYAYGGNYNWYTATAGNGKHNTPGHVDGSICPAGWHLPRSGSDEGFAALDVALGGSGSDNDSVDGSNRWRLYPINTVYNGSYTWSSSKNQQVASGRGEIGRLWGGSARPKYSSVEQGLGLWLWPERLTVGYGTTTNKWYAYGARCVAEHEENFTLAYDVSGVGHMAGYEVYAPEAQVGVSSDGYYEFTLLAPSGSTDDFIGWTLCPKSAPNYSQCERYQPGQTFKATDINTTLYYFITK